MLPLRRRAVRAAAVSIVPEPLRIPAFRAYWLARLTSTIAQMAMVIVIGWQVYDIARQTMDVGDAAFQLGLIGLFQFLPLFVLTPVSGWAADRFDRRHITRAVLLLELLCALMLFAATWRGLINLDRKSTRLNSSHGYISYAVFCLKKKKKKQNHYH